MILMVSLHRFWRKLLTIIRAANESDVQSIAEIYVDTWRSTYAGILPDKVLIEMSVERQMVIWARAIRHAGGEAEEKILVIENEKNSIFGVSSCGYNRDRNKSYSGEVYSLYIHPDKQNQGYGEKLLGQNFLYLTRQGFSEAIIWVLNMNPSRFFYEAMNGAKVGEREERLWGTVVKEIAYGWPDLKISLDRGRPKLLRPKYN